MSERREIARRLSLAWPKDRAFGSLRRPVSGPQYHYVVEFAMWLLRKRRLPPTPPAGSSMVTLRQLEALAEWAVWGDGERPPALLP